MDSKYKLLILAATVILAPILLLTLFCQASTEHGSTNATATTTTEIGSSPNSQHLFYRQIASSSSQNGANLNQANEDPETSLSDSVLRTYVRTNSMRAYHLDLHSYRPGTKFSGDPNFVDSKNPDHLKRCQSHLQYYDQLIKSFIESDPNLAKNSRDSLKLADTFGRPSSGILSGNQFWLGSYDTCLDLRLKNPFDEVSSRKKEPLISQYCLGLAQFPNWNPQDTKTTIRVGLCLPETCTTSMLNDNKQLFETVESMMKSNFEKPYNKLKLSSVYCLPHETSEARRYSTSTIAFFIFAATLVITCLISTVIDYLNSKMPDNLKPKQREMQHIVIESFSLIRNFAKIMYIRKADDSTVVGESEEGKFNSDTFFNTITGLKCIGLVWIICAHTFLVSPIPSNNLIDIDKLTTTYLANVYLAAHLIVDTFFALSGLLASYMIFKNGIHRITISKWSLLTVHRYLRLTPVYLVCYWFTKSVGHLMNTGPLWDYGTADSSPRLNCARESWYTAIFHLSDFKSPKDHCVPFAWFIANGIKFWLLTPFFLTLIHKSMHRGYQVIIGVIVASMVLVGNLTMRSDVDMKSVIEFKPESADNILNNMSDVYTRPYSRIGAYLVGLLAGHLIYLIETKQQEVKLSKNANIVIWTLVSTTVIVLTFVFKIVNEVGLEEEAIPWIFSISSALIRPLWALCTCWLVLALSIGQAKFIAKFLSANIWRILVKLSFCAYLLQGEVIAQLYLARSNPGHATYVDLIANPIVTTVITIFVSLLAVLFLEFPLIGIEELIFPRHEKEQKCVQNKISEDTKMIQTEKLKDS